MYSSLDSIDVLSTEPGGGNAAFQTDHRSRDELEAEPEISVLFAMSRVLMARDYLKAQGQAEAPVVYVGSEEPPPFLEEALAAVGASFEAMGNRVRRTLEPGARTPAEIAEDAFTGLTARVARRAGLRDPAALLKVLEAETLADRPDREADEAGYWTRVLELMAVVVAVLRLRYPGKWVVNDRSDVPFGFEFRAGDVLLPANRARRFIADGETESMFLILSSAEELQESATGAREKGPIMPNLRSREEAVHNSMLWRPLLDKTDSDAVPVIVYGNDGENTIGWLTRPAHEDRAESAHAEALANIARHPVDVEEIGSGDTRLCVVSNSYFATEKLLDVAFMETLHQQLDSELLAVGVPRRGLMFVGPVLAAPAMFELVAHEYEQGGTRGISPVLLVVQHGLVIGLVRPGGGEPEPEPKKKGFFRRLFGL